MGFFDPYEGAIFDLDGTLLDSMGLWYDIDREWFETQGLPLTEDMTEAFRNLSLQQSSDLVRRRFGLVLSPEEILRQWRDLCLEHYRNTVPLKRGAGELLGALDRRGLRMAIATSSFPAACEAALEHHRIRGYFSALIYTDQVRSPSGAPVDKRGPEVWRAAAQALGIPPARCVVFEDMYAALRGARAAGMGVVAVYDPRTPDWSRITGEVEKVVYSLGDLVKEV